MFELHFLCVIDLYPLFNRLLSTVFNGMPPVVFGKFANDLQNKKELKSHIL